PTGSDPLANGANFQNALNTAQCGDTIVLQAGAIYGTRTAFVNSYGPQGSPFALPNTTNCGGQYITVVTSNLAGLPPPGTRVSPAHASAMAKLVSYTNQDVVAPVLGGGWYQFIGIEFTNDTSVALQGGHTGSLIGAPNGGYYAYGQWAHDIVIDRCFFHPVEELTDPTSPYRSATRAIGLDGANRTVKDSYISGFRGWYRNKYLATNQNEVIDSEAITIVNGPGPYTIQNNFLEAFFNILFTGGGGGLTANTATVTTASLTHVTLSTGANLKVGDLLALPVPTFPDLRRQPSS